MGTKITNKLSIIILILIGTMTGAWAQDAIPGSSLTWQLTGTAPNLILTISGTGAMPDFANESQQPWGVNRTDITTVVVENGVTSIGDRAFYECGSLTSITLPASVANIGNYAFYDCTDLTSVTLLSAAPTVGTNVFDNTAPAEIMVPVDDKSTYDAHSDWAPYASMIKSFCLIIIDWQNGTPLIPKMVETGSNFQFMNPPRPGYRYLGLRDAPSGGNPAPSFLNIASNITAYAQWAPFSGGDGTVGTPYQISTTDDLKLLADTVNGNAGTPANMAGIYFIMTNDIDLNVAPYKSGEGWQPIGDATKRFWGTFDGDGNKITGLFINRPTTSYAGLFGVVGTSGTIENLGISIGAAGIVGVSIGGGLAGQNNGTISRCYTTGPGTVTGNVYAGGLVGENNFGATIEDSYSTVDVPESSNGGGLAGQNYGSISRCYATGSVTASKNINVSPAAGGLVGMNAGPITDCYATGNATATYNSTSTHAGGLTGMNSSTITSSYSTGSVSASGGTNNYAGGLIGQNFAPGVAIDSYAAPHNNNVYVGAGDATGISDVSTLIGSVGDLTAGVWGLADNNFPYLTGFATWNVDFIIALDPSLNYTTTVNTGAPANPPAPTFAGYVSGGWYEDAAYTTPWAITNAITADITLYAKWTQNSTPQPPTQPTQPIIVNVTGISLNKATLSLVTGTTETLIATITPSNATNRAVIWASSNPAVATVSPSGVVTAVSEGIVAIQVKTVDKGLTASCTVTVTKSTVGTEHVDDNKFAAYPNPTDGILTVTGLTPGATLRLYSATGTLTATYQAIDTKMTLDISHLTAGLYYINIDGQTLKVIRK